MLVSGLVSGLASGFGSGLGSGVGLEPDIDLDLELRWLLRLECVVLPWWPRSNVTVDHQPPHAAVEPLLAPESAA